LEPPGTGRLGWRCLRLWSELADFYAGSYRRVVAQVAILTGSRPDAEELVQDAMIRLLPRWSKVSRYDNPEAWLRSVAMRLATNRWRRALVAAKHLQRMSSTVAPVPDGSSVDLQRALLGLPLPQRQVIVLHYLIGLSVEEIARELRIASGTVKSRLSRGRSALAQLLAEEISA
jgi:RNA polymerase sigma-70 factor (ECF subfamily)